MAGKASSAHFVSCRHRTSGWNSSTQACTRGRRAASELTFQVASRTPRTVPADGWGAAYARRVGELSGDAVSSIHNHLQKARNEAASVKDPSNRRALEALVEATSELLAAVRHEAG